MGGAAEKFFNGKPQRKPFSSKNDRTPATLQYAPPVPSMPSEEPLARQDQKNADDGGFDTLPSCFKPLSSRLGIKTADDYKKTPRIVVKPEAVIYAAPDAFVKKPDGVPKNGHGWERLTGWLTSLVPEKRYREPTIAFAYALDTHAPSYEVEKQILPTRQSEHHLDTELTQLIREETDLVDWAKAYAVLPQNATTLRHALDIAVDADIATELDSLQTDVVYPPEFDDVVYAILGQRNILFSSTYWLDDPLQGDTLAQRHEELMSRLDRAFRSITSMLENPQQQKERTTALQEIITALERTRKFIPEGESLSLPELLAQTYDAIDLFDDSFYQLAQLETLRREVNFAPLVLEQLTQYTTAQDNELPVTTADVNPQDVPDSAHPHADGLSALDPAIQTNDNQSSSADSSVNSNGRTSVFAALQDQLPALQRIGAEIELSELPSDMQGAVTAILSDLAQELQAPTAHIQKIYDAFIAYTNSHPQEQREEMATLQQLLLILQRIGQNQGLAELPIAHDTANLLGEALEFHAAANSLRPVPTDTPNPLATAVAQWRENGNTGFTANEYVADVLRRAGITS